MGKEFLFNKYITNPHTQHIIYNDGCMISWWEVCEDVIIIHQADESTDNFVCVEYKLLENVILQAKTLISGQ